MASTFQRQSNGRPPSGIRPVLLRQRTISDGAGPRVLLLHGMADRTTRLGVSYLNAGLTKRELPGRRRP
ncbi:hypothetical protein [Streptomyces avermitilis]|uniref:hypothetical protein n=1 Tax=Streptomyces avermitilis TaxID=33903 RepID=UPI0037176B70